MTGELGLFGQVPISASSPTIERCENKPFMPILVLTGHNLYPIVGATKMDKRSTGTIYASERPIAPPESLEHLYADYRERLLRFVLSRVGDDRHTAEDIVQEAFAAALISLAGFRSRSTHYTWLCSIAQHKIADYYRRKPSATVRETTFTDTGLSADSGQDERHSPVEQWFERQETRVLVQHALQQLPDTYEEVLRLKYFDGLAVIEIGNRIGRSPKAVEGLLARARLALSRILSTPH